MTVQTFPYKPRALTMALGAAFFAITTPLIFHGAMTNDRGMIIDGLITLDIGQATIFLWCLFAGAVILTLGACVGVIRALTSQHVLVLGDDAFRVPKSGLSNTILTVAYKDITGLARLQIKSQHFLTVQYAGRKLNIASGMLPNRATFEEVCETIASRVNALHAIRH